MPFRLESPDSTHFFQFDSMGNIYIFAPGAGCSGEAKLVRPGDKLIFSSIYQWHQREGPSMSFSNATEESGLALSCLPAIPHDVPCEFKLPLLDDILIKLSHRNFSPETLKKICWVRKMYHDWRAFRHNCGLEFIPCDLEDKATTSHGSLKFTLCQFIMEIKKVNREDFPGKTLCDIIVCVQFTWSALASTTSLSMMRPSGTLSTPWIT